MAKNKKSANKSDTLHPSWAAHELCALALTLVLASWVVVKYGKQAQPTALNTARAEERAAKRAELRAADEKVLTSFGVTDPALKRYRLPIANAISLVVEKGQADPASISKEIVARLAPPSDLKLVEHPLPDFLADESELDDPALIAQGKTVFVDVNADWCVTCKFNEATVLDRGAVAAQLASSGVVAMRADWTNPDPAIAAYLEEFGRFGIPFNAVYGPALPRGIALPELLSQDVVMAAFGRAGSAIVSND